MKRFFFLVFLSQHLAFNALAQYPIGSTVVTFQDPARSNRLVETDIYYPAMAAGVNTPVAADSFPVVAFGHGFVMTVPAYENVWTALAPLGIIVCLPRTEGGFAPSHENFGRDLAFLRVAMQEAGATPGSPFFGRVSSRFAVMGHSMGGGAALLAAQYDAEITTVAAFAPAETTPSAIVACAAIGQPVLLFTGSQDCITPTAGHAGPMFAAMSAASCKAHVDVTGGNHCQFANYSLTCSFGESTAGCPAEISREQQQASVFSLLTPWLGFHLRGDSAQWSAFQALLNDAEGIVGQLDCAVSATTTVLPDQPALTLFPNPARSVLQLRFSGLPADAQLTLVAWDAHGRSFALMAQATGQPGEWQTSVDHLPAGTYRLVAGTEALRWTAVFLKQ